MANITNAEFIERVCKSLRDGTADIQYDNEGQVIIYTGFYEQSDTTLAMEPNPGWNDD